MKRILLVIGLVAVLAGAGWGIQAFNTLRASAKTSQFNEDVDNLFIALQQYKERVGSYPTGSNSDVAKALQGNNSKNLIILVGRKKDLNTKGEFVDPWGTPLRIYFSGEGVLVRSAGPNKRFDDSTVLNQDDYYRSN
jgi:type II secretory pathway pseudopilin PulG